MSCRASGAAARAVDISWARLVPDAGVRADTGSLEGIGNVELVTCDVTDEVSVIAAAGYIAKRDQGAGLAVVINNAGVIVEGALELVPPGEWLGQFEINVFGAALVTQKFLPLLRACAGGGRLINITATSARVSLPFYSPISASKAALETFSHAARVELAPWRIPVVIIEPGATRTLIFEKSAAAARPALAGSPPDLRALYTTQLSAFAATMANQKPSSPEIVAAVVLQAVTATPEDPLPGRQRRADRRAPRTPAAPRAGPDPDPLPRPAQRSCSFVLAGRGRPPPSRPGIWPGLAHGPGVELRRSGKARP